MLPFSLIIKMKIKLLLVLILQYCLCAAQTEMKYNSQSEDLPYWAKLMYSENPNEGEVINAYRIYYKENKLTKNKHTQYYKRWIRSLSRDFDAENLLRNNSKNSNQWECVGPWDFDQYAESRSYAPGASHVYTVEQSVSDANVLYAGTATAGAWKTTDKGNNWNLITSDLSLSSVYAIEIDHMNPDIIYISGNGGVYKSFNGGSSWSKIGDSLFINLSQNIKDIKLNPSNQLILYIASDQGLFKSVDGGNNFTNVMTGSFLEIEFHPSSSDTMYFIKQAGDSTLFYRSNDGGDNLTLFSNGWPMPANGDEQKRTEIAVTPANPDKIVALATGSANGGSGLYGIYISYDKGETWTFRCCGPYPAGVPDTNNINLMGWQPSGLDDGGQYYYDLALAINPWDENMIHVGGVNHWISFDDGVTFTCPAKWSEPHKKGYVHADIHDINYFGNDLWFACDGGVFYSSNSGDSIYKKMLGIAGTDFWGFGSGFKDEGVMLGGTYHNGTLLKDNSTYINDWLSTQGGDNIRGFVNFGNPRQVYHDGGGKILSGDRAIPLSSFSIDKQPNASYIIGESSQLEFDPRCHNWIYSGNDTTLWLSKNNGSSFEAIYHFDAKITSIEVAWSNPEVIYVATWPGWWDDKKIYRTGDGGKNWVDITPNSNTQNGSTWRPFDITVSSYDENIIWIARCTQSGNYSFIDGYKVFKSVNGGQSWINLTTPILDGDKPTNIEHHRGSDGGVYLGTRNSVYYRNNNMNDWIKYDANLPLKTLSTQLVPYYREGLLINGTNRSVYQVDLYENTPPSAQIAADKLEIDCFNDTVYFTDHSAVQVNSASWLWSFPGGIPSSSTLENPVVVYSAPGKYNVSLKVTDIYGSNTQTINELIYYKDTISTITNTLKYKQDFESSIFPPISWKLSSNSFSWQKIVVDTGINCSPSTVAYVNHYWINQRGKEAYLISNKIALGSGLAAQNFLTYDYAYSGYANGYNDGFRIDISIDCGATWDSIYSAYGSDLQTTSYVGSPWYPTCGSWKTDSINLSNFGYNGDTIMIRFVAINDYGNRFFLDNVNIAGQNILNNKDIDISNNIYLYPNPTDDIVNIRSDIENISISVYNSLGTKIFEKNVNAEYNQLSLKNYPKGVYFIDIEKTGIKFKRKKIILY